MSSTDQTADQALDRLQGSTADLAVVAAELEGLRRARAELAELRAMRERADEVANGEGWSWDEQVTARRIIGEAS